MVPFPRFKAQWENIKNPGIEDGEVAAAIFTAQIQFKIEIKSFCLAQLKEKQSRDDYKELWVLYDLPWKKSLIEILLA